MKSPITTATGKERILSKLFWKLTRKRFGGKKRKNEKNTGEILKMCAEGKLKNARVLDKRNC